MIKFVLSLNHKQEVFFLAAFYAMTGVFVDIDHVIFLIWKGIPITLENLNTVASRFLHIPFVAAAFLYLIYECVSFALLVFERRN